MNRQFSDYHRGEIYYADLDPVIGHEQGGFRPVLITQNDVGNFYSPTVIVAPLSRRCSKKPKQPTHVLLTDVGGLDPSMALVEQTRTLDKTRLGRYVGRISDEQMRLVEEAIRVSQGLLNPEDPTPMDLEAP